jgi:hypothetical protein
MCYRDAAQCVGDDLAVAEVERIVNQAAFDTGVSLTNEPPVSQARIPIHVWIQVLSDGLETGAHWRPEINVCEPGMDSDDQFYYYTDQNCIDDPRRGPFKNIRELLEDVLRDNAIAPWRLISHCRLSAAQAVAVLAYEKALSTRLANNGTNTPPADDTQPYQDAPPDAPRVLVVVRGGIAETRLLSGEAEVEIFDADNYKVDPTASFHLSEIAIATLSGMGFGDVSTPKLEATSSSSFEP